ncbi:MAG TPA: TMEM175 family protein [Candidatus Saccharimonadales bacterium]|nr:TMEM175 family protein [Candidatus Saccharimonadales bacterium]
MTHDRLHALTDGIFAIVMTLLVLEIKLPELHFQSNYALWHALEAQSAAFASYFISFAVLFLYWRAHNFLITVMAKNITINLLSINAVFLLLVGLIPFNTHLAGVYDKIPLAVSLYAVNIIAIGLTLWVMRLYIERSDMVKNLERSDKQRRAAMIRTFMPVVFGFIAIPLSFISTEEAYIVLIIGVGFNFLNNAGDIADKYLIMPISNFFKSRH